GGVDAIIVSDALWHRRFSGRDIVGQTIDVDGKPRTIVGIMPASFTFPLPGVGGQPVDVFLPLRMTAAYRINRGSAYDAYLLARLAPGVTVAQAKRAANDLVASYATLYPEAYRGGWKVVADVFPFRNHATADVRTPLLILLGAVALVLLVACLNVASLLLARAAARQREIAVRQALGASRTRLAQQFLWESLVLVVAGGAVGVLLAVFEARGSTASAARARGRRTLVAAEVAIALVLSTGAGLMARSFARALGVDPGFDPNHLVTVRVGLPDAKYATPASVLDFDRRVIDGLRTLPGVTSASASLKLPLQEPMRILIAVEGKSPSTLPIANGSFVMPQFLETMRIRL